MRNNLSIRAYREPAEAVPLPAGRTPEVGVGGCAGIFDIERCLGRSGLVRGRLHAIHPAAAGDEPAATGFALALLKGAGNSAGPILWVQGRWPAIEAGRPYGLGLAQLGLDPAGMIIVGVETALEVLAAAEMGLGCKGLQGVLAELPPRVPANFLVLGKRLSLRAEKGRVAGVLLHATSEPVPSPVATRWTVAARPSGKRGSLRADLGPAFDVALLKNRFGPAGRWSVVWNAHEQRFVSAPAHAEPVAAEAADRPARTAEIVRFGRAGAA